MTRPSTLKTDFAKALYKAGLTPAEFAALSGYNKGHIEHLCSGNRVATERHFKLVELLKKGKK